MQVPEKMNTKQNRAQVNKSFAQIEKQHQQISNVFNNPNNTQIVKYISVPCDISFSNLYSCTINITTILTSNNQLTEKEFNQIMSYLRTLNFKHSRSFFYF